MLKIKNWIFSKNCLTRFVSGREKKRAFPCTLSVLAKMFLTKTVQSRKHYKNRGFSGKCKKKTKMTPFFGKRCFLTWLKTWVLLTVVLKSCVFLKTQFLECFQQNTAFQKQKLYVEKNQKIYENSGLFLNMAKWCFLGLFFEVLILKGLFLVCLALFQKC